MAHNILIVDGHAIAFQSYHAISTADLTAPDGTPTGALVGFFNTLFAMAKIAKPSKVYLAFDTSAPTFRHQAFADYKANRGPMEEEMRQQMGLLYEILQAAGFVLLRQEGLEADDLIASGAALWSSQGHQVYIATGDKDLRQVLRDGVTIVIPRQVKGSYPLMGVTEFKEKYGFGPELMDQYLALLGDSSDNIPGVPLIGEKKASQFLQTYGSIQNLLAHVDDLTPKVRENLQTYGQRAIDMLALTRVKYDCDVEGFERATPVSDPERLAQLIERLGFQKTWVNRLLELSGAREPQAPIEGEEPARAPKEEPKLKTDDELAQELAITPNRGPQVSLEELVHSAPLAFDFDEGAVYLAARDGRWAQVSHTQAASLVNVPLIWGDKKAWLSRAPQGGWVGDDLTTLHYLLHPDQRDHSPSALLNQKACVDRAFHFFPLFDTLYGEVQRLGVSKVYGELDLPLLDLLVEMECEGLPFDVNEIDSLIEDLELQIQTVTAQLDSLAAPFLEAADDDRKSELFATAAEKKKGFIPNRVNWLSPKQVGALLYDLMGLPSGKKGKTGFSTSESQLEVLAQGQGDGAEVARQMLVLRTLTKIQTGFAEPLRAAALLDGKVHTTFDPHTAATGRLSSKNPNVQNLPTFGDWASRIKKAFKAPEGKIFIGADYSQIELRLMAHQSGNAELIDIFKRGADVHREVAAIIFNIPSSEVTAQQRRYAKMVSFGLIYGMTIWGLGDRLGLEAEEAKVIQSAYFKALPGVQRFMNALVQEAQNRGYCRTPAGRIRPLNEVRDAASHVRRVAINTPIQGQGADIMKSAMLDVAKALKGTSAKLLLQVHDSLVVLVDESEADDVAQRLEKAMVETVQLSVPLAVESKRGTTLDQV